MIGAADVRELARAQSLRDTVVEKDAFSVTDLREQLADAARRVYEASGIEVPLDLIRVQSYVTRRGTPATEVRLSYHHVPDFGPTLSDRRATLRGHGC